MTREEFLSLPIEEFANEGEYFNLGILTFNYFGGSPNIHDYTPQTQIDNLKEDVPEFLGSVGLKINGKYEMHKIRITR